MFYRLLRTTDHVNRLNTALGRRLLAVIVHALLLMMSGAAPGRCADCGSDAYIQLAVEDAMLCAHCYQDRLGVTKKAASRSGGERGVPKPASIQRRAS